MTLIKEKLNTLWKIITLICLFSLVITIFDLIFTHFEPITVGWGLFDYINYAGDSILIDVIVLFVLTLIFSSLFLLLGLFIKKKTIKENITKKSLSFSLGTLIIILVSYPINHYLLPVIFHIKSIIMNIIMFFSIIPISIAIYFLIFKLLKLPAKNKMYPLILVIISVSIILTSFIMELNVMDSEFIPEVNEELKNTPNIIIITIDALRADHLSCYGYDKIKTTNIDEFAKDSIIFRNAFPTTSWTTPSMMSMLTGKHPTVHGCIDIHHATPKSILLISQILKSYNYQTYAIVANKQLYYKYGFSRGFDKYLEYGDIQCLKYFRETRVYLVSKMIQTTLLEKINILKDTTQWVTNEFKIFLNNKNKEPFFLWVHYLDPHGPYSPPKEYIPDAYESSENSWNYLKSTTLSYDCGNLNKKNMSSILNLYDGEILYVDDKLGKVLDLIKERKIYDNSLIIISSDHGEEFWEHNGTGHGLTLYKEVLNIPLIVKLPYGYNSNPTITTFNNPVQLTSIPRTILQILGINGYKAFGENSILDITNSFNNEDNNLFYETTLENPYLMKIRTENYSLIYNQKSEKVKLYNLNSDPYEQNDISNSSPEKRDELLKKLLLWKEEELVEKKIYGEANNMGMDTESLEEIRGLGYIE